jgi:hypothetical protein
MRWSEEVIFLREEMRRVAAFLEWDAQEWEGRKMLHTGLRGEVEEGMLAYAYKQAHLRRSRRTAFLHLWRSSVEYSLIGIGEDNDVLDLDLSAHTDLLAVHGEDPLS